MNESQSYIGRCHCGNLEVIFETRKSPIELGVRACSCSFCRKHGARNTSDPQGRVSINIKVPAKLHRYRFGLKTADFLLCRDCGVYLGAVFTDGEMAYATINVNTFDTPEVFPTIPTPVNYDRETEAERRSRRMAKWTPVFSQIEAAR